MAHSAFDVPKAELAVLQLLWQQGPCHRKQLAEALYPGRGTVAYTTVQKLLERLQAKGLVKPHEAPGPRAFAAAVSRDELIGHTLRTVADAYCDGSLAPLLTNLVRARPLTPGQVQELRDLLDGLLRQQKLGKKNR